jgi:hypothetical protein
MCLYQRISTQNYGDGRKDNSRCKLRDLFYFWCGLLLSWRRRQRRWLLGGGCVDNVTNPPIPKAPDRPDFHRGQGFARRFAPKERELRLICAGWDDAKVVEPSKVLELRASQGRFLTPSSGESLPPSLKTRTPLLTPLVFQQLQVPLTASNRAFFRPRS